MRKVLSLDNQKFGRLTVVQRTLPNTKWNTSRWLCRCDCGKDKIIVGKMLTSGKTRSCGCLHQGQPSNDPIILSNKELDVVNGLLLSDGHLTSVKTVNRNSRLTFGFKYREMCEQIINNLPNIQFSPIKQYLQTLGDKQYTKYQFYSMCYPTLSILRKLWYPHNIKIVPSITKLTPECCYWWYLGDGYRHSRGIVLATDGFNPLYVTKLRKKLSQLGIDTKKYKNKNSIILNKQPAINFLDYIGPCQMPCYQYKWDYTQC